MTLSALASRRARRALLVPAALVLSASTLVACSSGSTTTETTTTTAADSDATTTATESATADTGQTVQGNELAGKMLAAMNEAGTFRSTSTQPGMEATTSEVQMKDGAAASSTTVDMDGSPLEIITVNNGAEVYIRGEAMNVPTWTKVDANSDNPAVAMMAGILQAMGPLLDPRAQMKIYEAATFTVAGQEEVNGVQTTKYTGELPLSAVMEAMGGDPSQMPAGSDSTAQLELYLDEQDRPIKLVQTMDGQTSETTYSDFGADITVEAPAVGS